jgi:hypothetical protein
VNKNFFLCLDMYVKTFLKIVAFVKKRKVSSKKLNQSSAVCYTASAIKYHSVQCEVFHILNIVAAPQEIRKQQRRENEK